MTYAVSFMLMAAGLILLMWTVAATLRFRREREEVRWSFATPYHDDGPEEYRPLDVQASTHQPERTPSYPSLGGVDWYELQCKAGRGVRYAPNMGGFTEVPLQLHDTSDNKVYVRKRIWVN